MRSPAKFPLCLLSAAPIACLVSALPVLRDTRTTAASLHETNEYTIINFQAVCSACPEEPHANFPLELKVHKTRVACDGTGIYLNGDGLTHTWDGLSGYGSGTLSSCSSNANAVLSAHWESVCTQSLLSDSEELTSQILTVRIQQVGDVDLAASVGFTVAMYNDSQPRILDISNPPWELITPWYFESWDEEVDFDDWDSQAKVMSNEDGPQHKNQVEEDTEALWNQLQDLKYKAQKLNQQVEEEEAKILQILENSCSSHSTKWEDCTTIRCKIRVSWSKIPALLRQTKFRFGSLSPSFQNGFCSQCPNHRQCTQSPDTNEELSSVPSEEQFTTPPASTPSPNNIGYIEIDPETTLATIDVFTVGVVVFLLGGTSFLTFMICHHSMRCRRRRADFAARREERQTRRAYRSAARRLQWQQWWEGLSRDLSSFSITPSTHDDYQHHEQPLNDLAFPDHFPNQSHPQQPPTNAESESLDTDARDVIQAEIWGFRQALNYVGELVLNPTQDLESVYSHVQDADEEIIELLNKRRNKPTARPRSIAATTTTSSIAISLSSSSSSSSQSSTAGLSTNILSPRTSSLMSLDTPSCVTLDTLETADTGPPPSYHP